MTGITISTPGSFYNAFGKKLLADYWFGNARMEAALRYALAWIPQGTRHILDIGCGIGWSTREFARHHPNAKIAGWDLSDRLVHIARELTTETNVEFGIVDFTVPSDATHQRHDAVVLLDVYEHFERERRQDVNSRLKNLLTDQGRLILAFPSVRHQEYLRRERPSGLQPVDEDVARADVELLSHDVGGRLVHWRSVSIWQPDDYVHATISREDSLRAGRRQVRIQPVSARQSRVRQRLGVRVLSGGLVASASGRPRTVVACPSLHAYSETFIRSHIERLGGNVSVLHGGMPPSLNDQGRSLLHPVARAAAHPRIRRAFPRFLDYCLTTRLARAISNQNGDVVLAEYGPMGATIADACLKARVPLVVHFHGYDAYQHAVLQEYGAAYRAMFQTAAAVVAVSSHMREQLVGLGCPDDKVHLIICGVDPVLFAEAMPAKAAPRFLAVGRFVDKKAPMLTLLAFAKVHASMPEVRLTMVGDGPLLGPCQNLAEAIGVRDAVQFRSVLSPPEVAAEMRRVRAFVQHSLTAINGDSEGTPVAVVEAQCCGLPVVATRHAGIPDVVVDGLTGNLVDECDVESMADRMLRLAQDAHAAGTMGQAARARVLEHFTLEQQIEKLRRLLLSVSGQGPDGSSMGHRDSFRKRR
ncbi:MAG: glycosyltransferase, partial [Patescibacteria group bacterium]|nr:glycosyltransferase [Patescibacteria group bacterium]